MNWLKALINERLLAPVRDAICREIDRAIGKLNSGQTASELAGPLQSRIADLIATARLPMPFGPMITAIVMSFDWSGLAAKPSADAVKTLTLLRRQIEGARL